MSYQAKISPSWGFVFFSNFRRLFWYVKSYIISYKDKHISYVMMMVIDLWCRLVLTHTCVEKSRIFVNGAHILWSWDTDSNMLFLLVFKLFGVLFMIYSRHKFYMLIWHKRWKICRYQKSLLKNVYKIAMKWGERGRDCSYDFWNILTPVFETDIP